METKSLEVGFYHSKAMQDGKEVYTWAISSNNLDRTGECLDINGGQFDDFLNVHSGIYYNHDLERNKPIGKGLKVYVKGDLLLSDMFFHEIDGTDSKVVKSLVDIDVVKTASVGFEPLAWIDLPMTVEQRDRFKARPWITNIRKYTKWRLLEWSVVNMPANLDAQLQNAKKLLEVTNSIDNKIVGDIMETKGGKVISNANTEKIKVAIEHLQSVLEAATKDDPEAVDGKCGGKEPKKDDTETIVEKFDLTDVSSLILTLTDYESVFKQVLALCSGMDTKLDMLIAIEMAEEASETAEEASETPAEPTMPMKSDLAADIRAKIKEIVTNIK